ncbi:MAG: cell wall hydrolase [Pseudomonadota bacterium]
MRVLTVLAFVLGLTSAAAAQNSLPLSGAVAFEAQSLAKLDAKATARLLNPRSASDGPEVRFDKQWLAGQPYIEGGAEWRCLSEALYFEARGETLKGQFAVAEVILNRVESASFPNTICNVITQGTGKRYQCQFTYTCDGYAEVIREPRAWEMVGKVARLSMAGASGNLTGGAKYYHTTAVAPRWARTFEHTTTIGVHRFYRPS